MKSIPWLRYLVVTEIEPQYMVDTSCCEFSQERTVCQSSVVSLKTMHRDGVEEDDATLRPGKLHPTLNQPCTINSSASRSPFDIKAKR
jgi:hypothetical protein